MGLDNGKPAQQGEPSIIIPGMVEAAQLYTRSFKIANPQESFAIVTLIINAPGRSISLQLLAEDAEVWGNKLVKEAQLARTKLITP